MRKHWVVAGLFLAAAFSVAAALAFKRQGMPATAAAALHRQGDALRDAGDDESAVVAYRAAERLFAELGDRAARRASAEELAEAFERLARGAGDADAESLYQEALEVRSLALGKAQPGYARSLNELGLHYRRMADYARAEPLLQRAVDSSRSSLGEEHPWHAASLKNLALLYDDMGDYARAEPLYLRAIAIQRQTLGEEHPDYAATVSSLGSLYASLGKFERAERLLLQALELRRRVFGEQHRGYATSLNNLGVLYYQMGDFARAHPLLQRALALRQQLSGEDSPEYAASLNNLAELYRSTADYARAEVLYRQALEVVEARVGKSHPAYMAHVNNLALLYDETGDDARADALYREALAIAAEVLGEQHPDYATMLNNVAGFHVRIGDFARAESIYRQALEIQGRVQGEEHSGYAKTLNNMAVLYRQMGDYRRAQPLYERALSIYREALVDAHPELPAVLGNLGSLHAAMGDDAEAERRYRDALDRSWGYLKLAADVQSERQQLAMTRAVRYRLDDYLSLAARTGQHQESAYRYVLAWKGAVLARQRAARAAGDDPRLSALVQELQTASARLAQLAFAAPGPDEKLQWQRQLAHWSQESERLESELVARSGAYREAAGAVTLEDVQRSLPDDAALIDFLEFRHSSPPEDHPGEFALETRMAAFVIRNGQPVALVDLGSAGVIGVMVDVWRFEEERDFGHSTAAQGAGWLLRRLLWEPLEPQLAGTRVVLVSPDGALGRLPLAALPGRQPGTYLLEECAIASIPAARELPRLLADEPRFGAAKLLLLGDVDYDRAAEPAAGMLEIQFSAPLGAGDANWSRLPGTEREVRALARRFRESLGEGGVTKLTGAEATPARLRQEVGRHRFVHLATHGFFALPQHQSALDRSMHQLMDAEDLAGHQSLSGYYPDLLSGLVLAGANRPTADCPGIVTAAEVGRLNLAGVEQVVLSACDTGLGETAGGEGVLGLQRALHAAGARTVVASMWKVDDYATKRLMDRYYENLWQRGMGKLDALREAQRMMLDLDAQSLAEGDERGVARLRDAGDSRRGRVPPYYWGAFVLSGDWR